MDSEEENEVPRRKALIKGPASSQLAVRKSSTRNQSYIRKAERTRYFIHSLEIGNVTSSCGDGSPEFCVLQRDRSQRFRKGESAWDRPVELKIGLKIAKIKPSEEKRVPRTAKVFRTLTR